MLPTAEAPLVEGSGIAKRWGQTAVHADLTFRIDNGITGLLGSNGSGKTTLIGMMLGLHRPDSGELKVFGLDPFTAGPDVRAQIGYSPEHHTLPADTQAFDLVRHIAELHGLPKRDATNRASDALYAVGLGEERFRAIGTMSTGQRQRVKLAQAIAHDPKLVVLDEPTDGLDPIQRDQMLALIRRCATEFGINVILSSHLLHEVERICDGVVIIGNGRVLANAAVSALRSTTDTYLVEVEDRADELAAALRGRGLDAQTDGNAVIFTNAAQALDVVRDEIATRGMALRRLGERERSLEDAFLEVLGNG